MQFTSEKNLMVNIDVIQFFFIIFSYFFPMDFIFHNKNLQEKEVQY